MKAPYDMYDGELGVELAYVLSDSKHKHPDSISITTYTAYKHRAHRDPNIRLRSGGGRGNTVLLSWQRMPEDWRSEIKAEFGSPEVQTSPLSTFFEVSKKARDWYDSYRFDNDQYLNSDQIDQYTINASVLDALIELKRKREVTRNMRGTSLRGMWPSLARDLKFFNDSLLQTIGKKHTLPASRKLKSKVLEYMDKGYEALIDGRAKNSSAQRVTQAMIDVWRDIYAGQGNRKPDYTEVWRRYNAFLSGVIDVIIDETGEIYDKTSEEFRKVSRQTVHKYQSDWQHKVIAHSKRSGNRQVSMSLHKPYHKFAQPNYAGSMISIDDRQPPFKNLKGNRIWFYNGIDLGSEAFTVWVHGESKEGIILEFYRQMVRNYHAWGFKLPYELECEMSLNSSYVDTFLSEGAMFPKVRIEANNARGKRIEAYYRSLRYQYEKDRSGWLARPHAILESNQSGPKKVPQFPNDEIITGCLLDIERWNNDPHSDQDRFPNMSRWDVQMAHQHPELPDMNWRAILDGIGYRTKTSMNVGRITLQHKHRVVGFDGEVATGEPLINIMRQIEGQEVEVRWLDGINGEVIKAFVYDTRGVLICELLGDLEYQRSELERTPDDKRNESLTAAYVNTVQSYIDRGKAKINRVTILENTPMETGRKSFVMPGLDNYRPRRTGANKLPELAGEFETDLKTTSKPRKVSTAERFK